MKKKKFLSKMRCTDVLQPFSFGLKRLSLLLVKLKLLIWLNRKRSIKGGVDEDGSCDNGSLKFGSGFKLK